MQRRQDNGGGELVSGLSGRHEYCQEHRLGDNRPVPAVRNGIAVAPAAASPPTTDKGAPYARSANLQSDLNGVYMPSVPRMTGIGASCPIALAPPKIAWPTDTGRSAWASAVEALQIDAWRILPDRTVAVAPTCPVRRSGCRLQYSTLPARPCLPAGLLPRSTGLRVAYVATVLRFARFWATIFVVRALHRRRGSRT